MRLDQALPKLGVVKRRTVVKELAEAGKISINGVKAKPSKTVSVGDIIEINGTSPQKIEILNEPIGSIRKDLRDKYYRVIS